MPTNRLLLILPLAAVAGFALWWSLRSPDLQLSPTPAAARAVPVSVPERERLPIIAREIPVPLPPGEIASSLSPETGESHSLALDVIMGWIREQRELTQEDRAQLLAYLAQPQPAGLEDGEWKEQVNPDGRALLESLGAGNRTLAEATAPALRRLGK